MLKRQNGQQKESLMFWLGTVPANIIIGLGFGSFRGCNRVAVLHPERIPRDDRPCILAVNHPSYVEPVLLSALRFPQSCWSPSKRIPYFLVGAGTKYDAWYTAPVQPRFIMVPRNEPHGRRQALMQMIRVVQSGHWLVVFPEGGRTFKGAPSEFLYSAQGHRMRRLESGIVSAALTCRAPILPIWADGGDRVLPNGRRSIPRVWERITFVIGHPLNFERGIHEKVALAKLTASLLKLADEVPQSGARSSGSIAAG